MSELHAAVITAFKNMGWEYREVPGHEVVECWFEAHHTKILVHAQTHAEAGIVTVVSNASTTLPATHLRAGSELVMRTNKQLNLGNFEIDWDSGQVMFRIANIFPPGQPDAKVIASLVQAAIVEMDGLTPSLSELAKLCTADLLLLSVPELMARMAGDS